MKTKIVKSFIYLSFSSSLFLLHVLSTIKKFPKAAPEWKQNAFRSKREVKDFQVHMTLTSGATGSSVLVHPRCTRCATRKHEGVNFSSDPTVNILQVL